MEQRNRKRNRDIYDAAKRNDVRIWEIAERLDIRDAELSRKLRKELTEREKERILKIIAEISRGDDDEPKTKEAVDSSDE